MRCKQHLATNKDQIQFQNVHSMYCKNLEFSNDYLVETGKELKEW